MASCEPDQLSHAVKVAVIVYVSFLCLGFVVLAQMISPIKLPHRRGH